jgi:hypothetical protein
MSQISKYIRNAQIESAKLQGGKLTGGKKKTTRQAPKKKAPANKWLKFLKGYLPYWPQYRAKGGEYKDFVSEVAVKYRS